MYTLITYGVAADMAAQNIRYAELTVTPYISIRDELPAEAFLEAIEDARQAATVILVWSCNGSSTSPPTSGCRRPS